MRLSTYYSTVGGANAPGPLRLLLAPVHHAMVGTPVRYCHDGYSLAEDYTGIEFSHSGPGEVFEDRWEWMPEAPGDRILTLRDNRGGRVSQRIIVHPDDIDPGSIVTLHNGDSITAPTSGWTKANYDRMFAAGVDITMRGTREGVPTPQPPVRHEGFPGRTYHWMLTSEPAIAPSSPFVFDGEFDLEQYDAAHPGATPTVFTFAYGTNDVGPASLEQYIVDIVDDAEALWTAVRAFWPDAQIAFFLQYNVLNEDSAWQPPSIPYVLWEYRQRRHRFLELMLARFYGRPNTHLLNTHASVSQANFAGNNVHPNVPGHEEITDMIYPWHRWQASMAA